MGPEAVVAGTRSVLAEVAVGSRGSRGESGGGAGAGTGSPSPPGGTRSESTDKAGTGTTGESEPDPIALEPTPRVRTRVSVGAAFFSSAGPSPTRCFGDSAKVKVSAPVIG
ncbi:unnamed protein product, partial [Discosporangium mesarthrocarpum]